MAVARGRVFIIDTAIKRCLLLINRAGGNAKNVAKRGQLLEKLRFNYSVVDVKSFAGDGFFDIAEACKGYDVLCISGGDGTLNSAINATKGMDIQLLYYPCGTVNDFSRTCKSIRKNKNAEALFVFNEMDCGEINDYLFLYVAAIGTFTSIGYAPKTGRKKLFKRLSYWFSALAKFRLHRIKAKIEVDGRMLEDTYTLIMAVKSRCVFGFGFNKFYRHDNGKGHLLLIKTPTGAFKLWRLFCRFFRAFFVGFKKEKDSKNIKFLSFNEANFEFGTKQDFCVDGEKYIAKQNTTIKIHEKQLNIAVIK